MKITVDIPDKELEEVIRHTRARAKRDAIVMAISDFNRRKRLERLAEQLRDLRRQRHVPGGAVAAAREGLMARPLR